MGEPKQGGRRKARRRHISFVRYAVSSHGAHTTGWQLQEMREMAWPNEPPQGTLRSMRAALDTVVDDDT